MTDLSALAERIEAAEIGDTDEWLEAAAIALKGSGQSKIDPWWHGWDAFMEARAYLDAAMTLLPRMVGACGEATHADFILECTNGGLTIAAMVGHDDRDKCSWGATPALALAAAALRSRSQDNGHE